MYNFDPIRINLSWFHYQKKFIKTIFFFISNVQDVCCSLIPTPLPHASYKQLIILQHHSPLYSELVLVSAFVPSLSSFSMDGSAAPWTFLISILTLLSCRVGTVVGHISQALFKADLTFMTWEVYIHVKIS